jgi:hypothetical protein
VYYNSCRMWWPLTVHCLSYSKAQWALTLAYLVFIVSCHMLLVLPGSWVEDSHFLLLESLRRDIRGVPRWKSQGVLGQMSKQANRKDQHIGKTVFCFSCHSILKWAIFPWCVAHSPAVLVVTVQNVHVDRSCQACRKYIHPLKKSWTISHQSLVESFCWWLCSSVDVGSPLPRLGCCVCW